MFTYFTDRDGKYQLKSLAESAFDPLSRTCRFMLTEEAHHMSVGMLGIQRVVARTLEVMKALKTDEPEAVRKEGAIDLPTLQRYMNFWFSSSLDLFGAEVSSNAASYFATGIKGRPDEAQYEDHVAHEAAIALETPSGAETVALRNAMNEVTRQAYIKDCEVGLRRWNRMIERAGFAASISLPSPRFRRAIGAWAGAFVAPDGTVLDEAAWRAGLARWTPSEDDKAFVKSLQRQVLEPGKMASWIAPPERGIDGKPVDYEYVRFN
jgi:benzoyl-CoA 2,3-dioxygenase component B